MVLDKTVSGTSMSTKKGKAPVKRRAGHSPAILGKGTAHRIRTKYTRKQKHDNKGQDST
jgi:hypothetical protein